MITSRKFIVYLVFTLFSVLSQDLEIPADQWVFRSYQPRPMVPETMVTETRVEEAKEVEEAKNCSSIRPSRVDVVGRCCSMLPYFDKTHSNLELLENLTDVIRSLSVSDHDVDKEVAMFACVLIPLVFLGKAEDAWCLLEKFLRALSHFKHLKSSEKRSSLELVRNLRTVIEGIRSFINQLSEQQVSLRPTINADDNEDDEDNLDDLKTEYLKDLMRSFG